VELTTGHGIQRAQSTSNPISSSATLTSELWTQNHSCTRLYRIAPNLMISKFSDLSFKKYTGKRSFATTGYSGAVPPPRLSKKHCGGPVYSKERKEHDNANVLLQSFSGIVENTYAIFRVTFLPLFLHQVA